MSRNDITGDRIITKITGDQNTYGENLEKIFGKRDWRNRPIPEEPNDEGSVTQSPDENKVGR
jgi:hypothetical protein